MDGFSICLEAIRNPKLKTYYHHFSGTSPCFAFGINWCRRKQIQDPTPSTLLSLLADYGQQRDSAKCEVDPSALAMFMLICRFPVSSIRPPEQHFF